MPVLVPAAGPHERAFPAALLACARAITDARAAHGILQLLSRAAGDELQALDRGARSRSALEALGLTSWTPTVADVERARLLGDDGLGPLVVLSMVRDGHVRDAATRVIERDARALATLALLIRIDDTVAPVAERAAAAFERRLDPARALDLVVALPLLDRAEARQRSTAEGARVRAAARDLLLRDDERCRAALHAALGSEHAGVRSAASRFAVADGSLEALALQALSSALDGTPSARVWAARTIAATSTAPAVARSLLPRLLASRMPALRRAAAKVAHRIGAADALEELTVDRDGAVRSMTRAFLGRAGGEEERARLRALLTSSRDGERIAAALAALAEVGRPEDFPAVAPWLHDERSRVVGDATRALVGIHASGGLEAYVDVLHDKLAHRSTLVTLEAARGLCLLPAALVRLDLVAARLARGAQPRRLRVALTALFPDAPA